MSRSLIFTWIIVFSLFIYSISFSQTKTPKFDYIRAVVPQCVFQDSYGFIWIGAQEGLIKYDGYTRYVYKNIPFDSTSLSVNHVLDIKEDSKGNLWIGTKGGGLNYFNQISGKFTHYLHDPSVKISLGGNSVSKIIVNDDGSLWLAIFQNGFTHMKFDSVGGPVYTRYTTDEPKPPHIKHYGILDMYKDDHGFLWLGTVGLGLQRLNIATGEIKSYKHYPDDPASISHNIVSSICEDDSGNLWIGTGFIYFKTGGGLNRFDRKSQEFTHYGYNQDDPYSLGSDIISDVFIDRNRNLWIGTSDKGIYSASLKELNSTDSLKFTRYGGAGDDMINSVFEDRQGNIWITSMAFYLSNYNTQQNKFLFYTHDPNDPKSLAGTYCLGMYIDSKNNIWVGDQYKGLTKFNPTTKNFKRYSHIPGNRNSLSDNWINTICEDNDGKIWIGTQSQGIDFLNPANGIFRHIRTDKRNPKALANNNIKMIIKSASGDLYIIFDANGMQIYNHKTKEFITLDPDTTTNADEDIIALYEEFPGKIWIGTRTNGLFGVTIKNYQIETVEHYIHDPQDKHSISDNLVGDIIQTQIIDTTVLWMSTKGGLNRFDLQTKKFTHVMEKDGLPTNFILQLVEDQMGDIWCTTSEGISKFNPRTGYIKNFTIKDGLPTPYFGGGRVLKAKDKVGRLYFSAHRGVIHFLPEDIRNNHYIPPIRLTDFKIFHKRASLDTAIHLKKHITLKHDQNVISFEFAALNFTSAEKNQYAYKMDGLIDDWIDIGTERTTSFTKLDPGNYVFRVKGSNNDDVWNEEGTSIRIAILPPWWETWWAYAIYLFLLISILYTLRKYDLKRQRLKSELELEHEHSKKLLEIDKMKSRFFANISHEFRTPLTLILGPINKLLSKTNDNDTQNELSIIQRSARRLHRLINQLLDLSKLESGGMTLQLDELNIVELVKQFVQSFESLAKRKAIKLEFNTKIDNHISLFDADKIEKILNNLISNAFKFTPEGGKIEVLVSLRSRQWEDSSVDEGVETTKQSQENDTSHKGLSLTNTRDRNDNNGFIQIIVSDTGIGIPTDRLDKIFDRFYQVDDSINRDDEGTGIGLALTKELVELHEGRITVQSEIGNGTIFSVHLPIIESETGEIKLEKDKEKSKKPVYKEPIDEEDTKNLNSLSSVSDYRFPIILVVEDNPDMRTYIYGHLKSEYQISEAENGLIGYEKAKEIIPDLIISDVMMPELDGYKLCEKLKIDERTSHIPVILLTARADTKDKIEGLETGADDYLTKPFEAQELKVRIRNLIAQRKKLHDHFMRTYNLDVSKYKITSTDAKFINKIIETFQKHLADHDFSIKQFASEIGFSHSQFVRKIESLTGITPSLFLRQRRLLHAKYLFDNNAGNVSQVAYDCGFNNLSYFSRAFKDLFGQTPSEYLKTNNH